jgi:hypothetical protein
MSVVMSTIGCGLVLAGFAAENFAEHRWQSASGPAPLDALTLMGLVLPLAGVAMLGVQVF